MEGKEGNSTASTNTALTAFTSLVSGFLLLGTGFFAGWYWQNAAVQDVVKLEIVENAPTPIITPVEAAEAPEATVAQAEAPDTQDCQFVGSKNSDKYHSPTSGSAKRILPENIVCFGSEEEAEAEGYEEGTVE